MHVRMDVCTCIIMYVTAFCMLLYTYLENEKPLLSEMDSYIVPRYASKWKRLGIHLNIEPHLLQNIEKNNPNDCEASCTDMLIKWQEMNKSTSWGDLISALDKLAINQKTDG